MTTDPLRVWAGEISGLDPAMSPHHPVDHDSIERVPDRWLLPEGELVAPASIDGVATDIADRATRLALNPIVRSHLDARLPPARRAERYGSLLTDYRLCDKTDAQVAALPRLFEEYPRQDVMRFVDQAERAGLKTLVFSGHDVEPILWSASMILLHPGPSRGAQPHAHSLAVPPMITDRAGLEKRPDGTRPSVAFCGQGASRPLSTVWHALRRSGLGAINRLGARRVVDSPLGHIPLRASALQELAADHRIDDRFVVRNRYRAGVGAQGDLAPTQSEFDDNLRSATYALCVRGGGNFSVRFYEALSFGRVPLFVNTDCVLPFESDIDWRSRTVWVERKQLPDIADHLVQAHPTVLDDPKRSAESLRRLWQERLTPHGYYRHLAPVLRSLL